MFWVAVLYFSQGFPYAVFYDVFPVYFREHGVDLRDIGWVSLLGLAWTVKFLWAPAVDHYRHHRRWMFTVSVLMGTAMLALALQSGVGISVWTAIGVFALLSATNDIAIDGYTIDMLDKDELGLANGLRIGFYRVGMLAAGFFLIVADYVGWGPTYVGAAALVTCVGAFILLRAPRERMVERPHGVRLGTELRVLSRHPLAAGAVSAFLLGALGLTDRVMDWGQYVEGFWWYASAAAVLWIAASAVQHRRASPDDRTALREGPMFGTLLDMLQRRYIVPVILFILTFKLGDAAMGLMVKPFWVDAGFSLAQIGTISVTLGIVLSIAGGIVGGWITDRIGTFHALWLLGLFQAVSNLGYAWVAHVLPAAPGGHVPAPALGHVVMMYSASGLESFTGGLGTGAFLAFLMAIVNRRRSAAEYALLSSIFALSRSLAGWASGYGAHWMGYSAYFLLTFFLSFPAYLLLPWVKGMLLDAMARNSEGEDYPGESRS